MTGLLLLSSILGTLPHHAAAAGRDDSASCQEERSDALIWFSPRSLEPGETGKPATGVLLLV
jgi:hypothetical protein